MVSFQWITLSFLLVSGALFAYLIPQVKIHICHLAYPAARRTDGKYREDVGTYQYPPDTALRQSHQHTTQP